MLHHDFTRAVMKDRVSRFQEEADREEQERTEDSGRSQETKSKSGLLRVVRSLLPAR